VKRRFLEPIAFPVAAMTIRLLAATWRLRVRNGAHLEAARASGRPVLFALWHSRILPLLFHHRGEGVVTLIAAPVLDGSGEVIALLWAFNRSRTSFTPRHEATLASLAQHAALRRPWTVEEAEAPEDAAPRVRVTAVQGVLVVEVDERAVGLLRRA